MCIHSLDDFYHQTCNLLLQSSINIIFFRTCFCQIFYSQDNAEEVYHIAHAEIQWDCRIKVCVFNPPAMI